MRSLKLFFFLKKKKANTDAYEPLNTKRSVATWSLDSWETSRRKHRMSVRAPRSLYRCGCCSRWPLIPEISVHSKFVSQPSSAPARKKVAPCTRDHHSSGNPRLWTASLDRPCVDWRQNSQALRRSAPRRWQKHLETNLRAAVSETNHLDPSVAT